jgi:dipeptidyl aminopeptidase/acylaminoacyl peptidase/TolA-binding protein
MAHRSVATLLLLLLPAGAAVVAAQPRPVSVDDLFALREVGDPQVSPDGQWVAYTVRSLDAKEDAADTDIYLAPAAGGDALRLTTSPKSDTRPRFSPDGKWIAFLSSRQGTRAQVYLMRRAGGEAQKLTDFKGGVSDLAWSPDATRLALVVSDPDPDGGDDADEGEAGGTPERKGKEKTAPPIVIRRLQFKRDGEGYLRDQREHLHVFDVAARTHVQVTSGPFDDRSPAWSPDGTRLVFVSNRTLPDPDASQNADLFTVEAKANRVPRVLAGSPAEERDPVFSPDGRFVAYVQGGDPKDLWYGASHLAVVPAAGGPARAITASLDRNVLRPRFAADGRALLFLVEDAGAQHLARVPTAGGAVERIVAGDREVQAFDLAGGTTVVLESSVHQPSEISVVGPDGGLARVTRENDALVAGWRLGPVERFEAQADDGTTVQGFLTLPPGHTAGARVPALLLIHGGPASQYAATFEFQWQLFAARGYAVIAANPRGSTGRGTAYSRAIWADWGNRDFDDVMAAVDHVVARGVADPDRLGVGGWSYGGILTNYVIAKSTRFRAAVSGAGIGNYLAGYGTDHYQYEYEVELGLPWKARDLWVRLSSPFFDVEQIVTPTLFLVGANDVNVPLLATEQMYQAVRRAGKAPTEMVIYPGQWHSIRTPSYQKDRWERYLAWYDRYLTPAATTPGRTPETTSLQGVPLYSPALAADAQAVRAAQLNDALQTFAADPGSADAAMWLGRRLAAAGRYREAVDAYTRAIARHPADARLYRLRGHRYITLRQFDLAVADLTRASRLIAGTADEPEPGPNPGTTSSSTLHFAVWYHLGLAHYLTGDFAAAERAYRRCLETTRGRDDGVVAVSDWLYMTLRRQGKTAEAAAVLAPIHADMTVTEDRAYLDRLLMYKGELAPDDLLRATGDPLNQATYGYAVGTWYLVNGDPGRARAVFDEVLRGSQWPAFGYIAAEVEIAALSGERKARGSRPEVSRRAASPAR